MKKFIFIAITFVLGVFSAHAEGFQTMNLEKMVDSQDYQTLLENFNRVAGTKEDKFQQIIDLADKGEPASFDDTEGVYTGRCYHMVSRNLAISSALLIGEYPTKDGPLFPKEKLVIEGGHLFYEAADVLDFWTKEKLTSALMFLKSEYSSVVERPLSVVVTESPTASHNLTIFKNQNLILGLFKANQDQELIVRRSKEIINVKKGDIWFACYYFNKK